MTVKIHEISYFLTQLPKQNKRALTPGENALLTPRKKPRNLEPSNVVAISPPPHAERMRELERQVTTEAEKFHQIPEELCRRLHMIKFHISEQNPWTNEDVICIIKDLCKLKPFTYEELSELTNRSIFTMKRYVLTLLNTRNETSTEWLGICDTNLTINDPKQKFRYFTPLLPSIRSVFHNIIWPSRS